ncbi:MAG: hypothetical protein WAV41_00080 [Microgenomates group bacterium]
MSDRIKQFSNNLEIVTKRYKGTIGQDFSEKVTLALERELAENETCPLAQEIEATIDIAAKSPRDQYLRLQSLFVVLTQREEALKK